MQPDQPVYTFQPEQPAPNRSLRNLVLAILAVAVLAIIGFALVSSQHFKVVSTSPDLNNVSQIAPFIKVNFNKNLSSKNIKLSSSPSIISSSSISQKTLTINLKTMSGKKTYSIVIESISDTLGARVTNETLTFTTQNIAYSSLPSDQQKAIVNSQDTPPTGAAADPILQMSYTGTNYSIAPTLTNVNGKSVVVINITIQLNQADMSDQDAATANYEQQALSYIQSQGFNPSNYTVNYTVQTP